MRSARRFVPYHRRSLARIPSTISCFVKAGLRSCLLPFGWALRRPAFLCRVPRNSALTGQRNGHAHVPMRYSPDRAGQNVSVGVDGMDSKSCRRVVVGQALRGESCDGVALGLCHRQLAKSAAFLSLESA